MVNGMETLGAISKSLTIALVVLPIAAFWQSVSPSGQEVFTQYCTVCHGSAGEGASAPDLTNPTWQSSVDDQQLANTIRNGARGTAMPAFGARLRPDEVQSLIVHIRTLAKDAIHPANSPHIC